MPRQPKRASRRARFLAWVKRRYSTRLHMTLILSIVVLVGLLGSKVMLWLGVTHMGLRWGFVVLLGYGVFFGAVRTWIQIVRDRDDSSDATELFGEVGVEAAEAALDVDVSADGASVALEGGGEASGAAEESSGSIGDLFSGGDEGVGVVIVLAVVAAVLFGVAIWAVWQAPVILSETAAEVILVASLRRPTRNVADAGWAGSLLRATWLPALIALAIAVAGGSILSAICPEATKATEAIRMCVWD